MCLNISKDLADRIESGSRTWIFADKGKCRLGMGLMFNVIGDPTHRLSWVIYSVTGIDKLDSRRDIISFERRRW